MTNGKRALSTLFGQGWHDWYCVKCGTLRTTAQDAPTTACRVCGTVATTERTTQEK